MPLKETTLCAFEEAPELRGSVVLKGQLLRSLTSAGRQMRRAMEMKLWANNITGAIINILETI